MSPNQSKELLIDPEYGYPVIDYSLKICELFNINPIIITRSEKQDLIDYCTQKNIQVQIIEPYGEWPHTVLQSQPYWEDTNVLILPDTRFDAVNVVDKMKQELRHDMYDVVFARHQIPTGQHNKWGIVRRGGNVDEYIIYEKPEDEMGIYAWGLIGFKKEHGARLFSGEKVIAVPNSTVIQLESFKDITRKKWD